MVPDRSSLSRRRFLGGLAGGTGLVGGGTLAVAAKRPTALPNAAADWAANYYPTPPARNELWRPTVAEDHAREAVALLAETDEAAREHREEIDRDRRGTVGAGGWLETAEESLEDGDYADALHEARYGLRIAGEDLGEFRAELGRADPDDLAERSRELSDRIDALADELDPYPVVDPERDLAWYVEVEAELQRGRQLSGSRGLVGDGDSDVSADDTREIGEVTSRLLRAEIAVGTAERYYDRLRETVEGSDVEYGDHLRSVVDDLAGELEPMPTRDEVRSEYVDEDEPGPYGFAHRRLARWCFPSGIGIPIPWKTSVDDEFLAVRVLGLARGLIDWRAHGYATDELVLTPDDEGFDSGHVLAEKRRAKSTFERIVGSDPAPFLVVFTERAIGHIRVADVDRDSWDDSWEPWQERVQAYLHALVGRARLRKAPDVYDRVVDRS